MAVIASSPVRSPAAAVNVSSTRRKHRSTSARNSAFLVGKSRNRYGWLIPARRATSSVEVPASPPAANSGTAASSTISRRSAAGIRCLVITVMGAKLVTTHYFVKRVTEVGFLSLANEVVGPPFRQAGAGTGTHRWQHADTAVTEVATGPRGASAGAGVRGEGAPAPDRWGRGPPHLF